MVHVFDNWRIDTASREVRRGETLVALPRRVFDLVVYLIEHRARAVGRDELVAAVWGRVDVADVQVSQLIARTRRLLGDDAQAQATIRTIAGFGYRWVMPVQTGPAPAAVIADTMAEEIVREPVAVLLADESRSDGNVAPPTTPAKGRRRRVLVGLAFAAVLLAAVLLALQRADRRVAEAPLPDSLPGSLAVLPLQLDAPADSAWVELGLMDLVAGRLRSAGIAVPPSESVLVALHGASGDGDAAADAQRLQRVLRIERVVRGSARQSASGWRVTLEAQDSDGQQHRVEASQADVIESGRQAADLLLAALGHAQAPASESDASLEQVLQRSQAAILAAQFDVAREILQNAGEAVREHGRTQLQLAQIDYYRGQVDAALSRVDDVLASGGDEMVRLRAHTARGMLLIRRGDCGAAEQAFSAALAVRERGDGTALAGRGLARSCADKHAAAVEDLGLARLQLEAAGDRLGVARVDNYLGIADANRERLEPALARFQAALEVFDAFGIADAQRAALSGLLDTHVRLLRWNAAQLDAQRLADLRPRISDLAQRQILDSDRARVLLGLGRLREAAQLLDHSDNAQASGDAQRYLDAVRADLAWQRGEAAMAATAAQRALREWPSTTDAARHAHLLLLNQRAGAGGVTLPLAAPVGGAGLALLQLAQAEASPAGEVAEAQFRRALDLADATAVPQVLAEVSASYAYWLLRQGRSDEAAALSGRLVAWSAQDFDCALLRVALFHARGERDAWTASLAQARSLAGERPVSPALARPPPPGSVRNVMK